MLYILIVMKHQKTLVEKLDDRYFWDVELSNIDAKSSKRFIIERVFSLGSIADMKMVIMHYGREQVIGILTKLNYLDPKTLNFVSKLFNKPLSEFRCYLRKQSLPRFWSS